MSRRCYPYAIVPDGSAPLSGTRGVRGAEVTLVPVGGVGVWASVLEPFEPLQEDLLAHHAVVEAACAAGPALPVRFGTSFPDAAALARALEPRVPSLCAALAAVGSKREIAVTLAWRDLPAEPDPPADLPPDAGPGRRFMAQRAALWSALESRRARATELDESLRQMLQDAGIERDGVKVRIVPAPRVALSCAVLIEPGRAADVIRSVREAADRWPDVTPHLAGPWPPYSFADGD